MKSDDPTRRYTLLVCKFLFFLILWVPHRLLRIGSFIFSLPGEWRAVRAYQKQPKRVLFYRLSDRRVKLHMAASLVDECRQADGQEEFSGGRPSLIGMFGNLIREHRSSFWKIGSIEELRMIPTEEFRKDIKSSPLTFLPEKSIFIWAIDGHSGAFVAYNPFMREVKGGIPEDYMMIGAHEGEIADSTIDECFPYAVSVRVIEEKDSV